MVKKRTRGGAEKTLKMALSEEDYGAFRAVPLTPAELRRAYSPPATFGCDGETRAAADSALERAGVYDMIGHLVSIGAYAEAAPLFPGYAVLSGLSQNALIRAGVETVADEMTRSFVTFSRPKAAEDDSDRGPEHMARSAEKFRLRGIFHRCAEYCGYFGGCLLYIDTGASALEAAEPLFIDGASFRRGSLRGFVPVEPVDVYPGEYNASDPLSPDYFEPSYWWVRGRKVHASRFIKFSSGDLPAILKPAYNFFGISPAQLALDYVAHFTQTREAAARLLTKFSLTVFKTDMSGVLTGGGSSEIDKRIGYLVKKRSNDGVLVVDKETEDVLKLETPLSGVQDIVRQSLELLAAVFRIPAVKLLGISPAGFNATGESDLRNYYDHVSARREKIFREPLEKALAVLQVNEWGERDAGVTFEFAPLGTEDEEALARVNKIRAETGSILIKSGAVTPEEERLRIAREGFKY